jgi:hypothetical protein
LDPTAETAELSAATTANARVNNDRSQRWKIGSEVGSFVGCGPDVATVPSVPDWIITNPPFNLACEFALRAISIAHAGVALLVRSAWSEGGDRYRDLFSKCGHQGQEAATTSPLAAHASDAQRLEDSDRRGENSA